MNPSPFIATRRAWFGGGGDITPMDPAAPESLEDAARFHAAFRAVHLGKVGKGIGHPELRVVLQCMPGKGAGLPVGCMLGEIQDVDRNRTTAGDGGAGGVPHEVARRRPREVGDAVGPEVPGQPIACQRGATSAPARRVHDAELAVARDGTSPATDPIASAWYRNEVLPVHLGRLLLA